MQKVISNCKRCIQHGGTHAKAPMWSTIVTAPLELLHIDFNSIETMMELDQPPTVVNILVFCDNITKHVMTHVNPTKLQKLLLSFCDKAISQSSEHWLSSWVTEEPTLKATLSGSFVSFWVYGRLGLHAQTNGQVEWAHQTLMCMIGKLGRDQKVDWPKHLPKLVHAYNLTQLAITGYSLHYLMYGHWPHLPTDFYFPMVRGMTKHQHVDHYVTESPEWLWEAFKEAQVQSM